MVGPWLMLNLLSPEKTPITFLQSLQTYWARWDGLHYVYLANNWYTNIGDAANFIVFFPLYPLILKIVAGVFGNTAISGIFLSTVLFLIATYFFYKVVKDVYGENAAVFSVIALGVFPTSYFFNSPYTESLFLLIFSVAMYYAERGNWIVSGITAGLGVITRPFGILLLPSILIEWFYSKKRKLKQLPILIFPSLIAGLLYLNLNKITYGNFFEFQKILASHWQKHPTFFVTSILDSWRIAFSGGLSNYVIMVGWMEAISITVSWLLIFPVIKYLKRSWAVFYILSVFLFSSTSFILSTPRYLLSVPPLFALIGIASKNKFFALSWGFVSVALLALLATLFASGQWAF